MFLQQPGAGRALKSHTSEAWVLRRFNFDTSCKPGDDLRRELDSILPGNFTSLPLQH